MSWHCHAEINDVTEKDIIWVAAHVSQKPVCTFQHYWCLDRCAFYHVQGTNTTSDHHNCWPLNFILMTVWMVPVLFRRTWHPWFSKTIWVVDWTNHVCVFIHSFVDSFIHWLMHLFVMEMYMIQSNITCVDLMEWFFLAQGLFVFWRKSCFYFSVGFNHTFRAIKQ